MEKKTTNKTKGKMNHCDRKIAHKRSLVMARGNKYQIEAFNNRYGL